MEPTAWVMTSQPASVSMGEPAEHGVLAVDFAREQGHAFVLGDFAVDGQDLKIVEVGGFDEFGQSSDAVVSGVSGVVGDFAVVIGEFDKAGVLNAFLLGGRNGENNAFGNG